MKKIKAPQELVPYLKEMLHELQSQRFIANQVPDTRSVAIEGHNIWVAESHNPKWYSDLIRRYPKHRKRWSKKWRRVGNADSIIVRGDIEKLLCILIEKSMSSSKYAEDILEIAHKRFVSNKQPVSDVEIYFWECFKLVISIHEVMVIEKIPKEFWELIAKHKLEHLQLPDWAYDFHGAPF